MTPLRLLLLLLPLAGSALAQEAPDPAAFGGPIDNPWLPLTPGTVLGYQGQIEEVPSTLVVTVTDRTRDIAGVACVVVEELVSTAGRPVDRTLSYYAQDASGNVWTFGEDVQELDRAGRVARVEGWRAGLDGAVPGLAMEAAPAEGHELVNPSTDDHAEVLSLATPVATPSGDYPEALRVMEWTPDEPDVRVEKYYVQGIGLVRDVTVAGDPEEFRLSDIAR